MNDHESSCVSVAVLGWRLDALEMLTERAIEMHVNGEYGEAQRILSVLSCLIGECRCVPYGSE